MLIFYIICSCLVFVISTVIFQFNRLAIYRRRIIRHFAQHSQHKPFILSDQQEQQIKQHFLRGDALKVCIHQIESNNDFSA